MKCLQALLLAPLVLGACAKSNNVPQLKAQANAVAKTYAPMADELDKRRQAIFARGKNVPGNLPDVPEVVRLIGEAGDKITEMKNITSAIDKQADEAAKANNPAELEKLIDESHEKLENDQTVANEDLTRVEGWLWQFEQGRGAQPAPPPPSPTATNEAPEPTNAGSGAGSAGSAPSAAADKAAPTDKADKAKSDKTEKAAQKAATEKADKKAAAPAEKKASAPKTGAGSAAK
jgi:hypothetical protein